MLSCLLKAIRSYYCVSTFKINILFLYLILLSYQSNFGEAIRCYCTDDNCHPYGACEASICLVGLVKNSNTVIRTCADTDTMPLGCKKNVDGKWLDLCACDNNFCNSFSHLRSETKKEENNYHSAGSIIPGNDDSIAFNRVDTPDYDFPGLPNPNAPLSTRTSLLTIVLVVVPLSVGAAAIIVVAFNYYCHLC
uniref:Activin_recp domain-containing protein n=1 Tax=Rhabditophanes sp. KR3021 TaxID=114890 RepID=A0AC35U4Q9_9BILA